MKMISKANTPSKKDRKAMGMFMDFSVFFSCVLSIKQSKELESSRADLSSL